MHGVTVPRLAGVYYQTMPMKFYTQFEVDDGQFKDSNLFSGIVELQSARGRDISEAQLQYLLAKNFDIDFEHVHLVSWCRLH